MLVLKTIIFLTSLSLSMYVCMYMPVEKFVLYISQGHTLTIIIKSYDYNNISE